MSISTLHFVRFSFYFCSMMTTNNQDVFMNGMREDGEGDGFPLSVFDYGVGIGEAQGFGSVHGGHGSEADPSEVKIDKKIQ
jgi:hypothetical protein